MAPSTNAHKTGQTRYRAIEEYCDDIWNVGPVTVKV